MECQKNLFSLRNNVHYLNCAYKAPLLKAAEAAAIQSLIRDRNPMDITADHYFEDMPIVRNLFAQIINAQANQIAIIPSASYGLSAVLKNTPSKKNGHAIAVKDEFPSGYFSLRKWAHQHSNDLITVEPDDGNLKGESWNKNILAQINQNTSVVLLSSIHWMNGIKFDLEAIGSRCRQVGARFIVDGTQSVGALPMNIEQFNIDALVCAGYKWLLGPYSLSLAFFGDHYNDGEPLEESWLNRTNAKDFSNITAYGEHYKPKAGRYNVGETCNFTLMPMLKESLKQIVQWGPENIQQYTAQLIKPLMTFLKGLGIELEPDAYFCSHHFSLQLPETVDLDRLKENLTKNHVYLSVRGKYLRVAVNVFNDASDIDMLIETITQTLKQNEL